MNQSLHTLSPDSRPGLAMALPSGRAKRSGLVASRVLLAVVGVAFAVSFYALPCTLDGWINRARYAAVNQGSMEFGFGAFMRYLGVMVANENFRFAQLMTPFFTSDPVARLICATIGGGAAVAVFGLFAKLLSGRLKLWSTVVSVTLLTVCLPWRAQLMGLVYGLNFVIPGAAGMWVLWILREQSDLRGIYQLAVALALLLLGHEIIAISVACGLIGWVLIDYRRIPRGMITIVVCNWMAVLCVSLAGELPGRIVGELTVQSMPLWEAFLKYMTVFDIAVAWYLGCLIWPAARRRALELLRRPVFAVAMISAVAMAVISVQGIFYARHTFWTTLASLVSIVELCRCYRPFRRLRLPGPIKFILTCIGAIVMVGLWVSVAYTQVQIGREYDRYVSALVATRTNPVTIELHYLNNISNRFQLGIPTRNLIGNPFDYEGLRANYPSLDEEMPQVVDTLGRPYQTPRQLSLLELLGLDAGK